MLKGYFDGGKPHFSLHLFLFRAAGVLSVLTLISLWFVSGMLAKYTTQSFGYGGARVAAAGEVSIYEHKAVPLPNGTYSLDTSVIVSENKYNVVPGLTIPKDPIISLTGKNEVSCFLYLEVIGVSDGNSDVFSYSVIEPDWERQQETGANGGVLYKYNRTIKPHEALKINVLQNDQVRVKDSLKNKLDPSENSSPYTIKFFAYLIQAD